MNLWFVCNLKNSNFAISVFPNSSSQFPSFESLLFVSLFHAGQLWVLRVTVVIFVVLIDLRLERVVHASQVALRLVQLSCQWCPSKVVLLCLPKLRIFLLIIGGECLLHPSLHRVEITHIFLEQKSQLMSLVLGIVIISEVFLFFLVWDRWFLH